MSLGEQLEQVLAPGPLVVERPEGRVEAQVLDLDRLGTRLERIKVSGEGRPLEELARALPEALHVLPERMVAVEVDPGLGGAVFRSDPADMRRREYFEARSDGCSVELERFVGTTEGRERRSFTLTREQLGRMVDRLGELLST